MSMIVFLKKIQTLFTLIIFFLFLLMIFTQTVLSQVDEKSLLAKAVTLYKDALFDESIQILIKLSSEVNLDDNVRKDALRFLGRAYSAKGLYDKAKESIIELLNLEPPPVTLDPDCEPPVLMKVYYDARRLVSGGSLSVEKPDPGMKTMAIIDFKNSSIDHKEKFDPMEKGFADLMIHRLNNSTGLKVIERDRIQWILNEINIQDKYSMEGAVRVGKQLGVHAILLGSYIIFKDEIWLGVRLVKVETTEILVTAEVKGDIEDFYKLTEKLSKNIAEKIDVTLRDYNKEASKVTNSLDAILTYSEGLSMLEAGRYIDAYNKFLQALEYDPNYELARVKAESIKPFIG